MSSLFLGLSFGSIPNSRSKPTHPHHLNIHNENMNTTPTNNTLCICRRGFKEPEGQKLASETHTFHIQWKEFIKFKSITFHFCLILFLGSSQPKKPHFCTLMSTFYPIILTHILNTFYMLSNLHLFVAYVFDFHSF